MKYGSPEYRFWFLCASFANSYAFVTNATSASLFEDIAASRSESGQGAMCVFIAQRHFLQIEKGPSFRSGPWLGGLSHASLPQGSGPRPFKGKPSGLGLRCRCPVV